MGNVIISSLSGNSWYEDRYEIIGEPKYIYYVEVKEIEMLLIDYLNGLNKFPIYLTLTTYNDYEEFEELLIKLDQEYQVDSLSDVVYASTEDGGMIKYNVPIFKVNITDIVALKSIISNSFWMAESNCTYILSFTDNVSFKNGIGRDWKCKVAEFSTVLIDMSQETTAIGITHDAYGFLLFSNLEECHSVETISKQLPNYTIITGE